MKQFLKKYGSVFYIVTASIAIVIIVLNNTDIRQIAFALRQLRPWPTIVAGLCIVAYFLLRTATTGYYLRVNGYRLSWRELLGITGSGEFYSAITPSASGGQPAQVLYMCRCGLPAGVATACICVKFLGFQIAFQVMGAVLWFTRWDAVARQIYGFRWLVGLGFALNLILVLLVLLTIPKGRAVDALAEKVTRLLGRIHILRKPEESLAKFKHTMEDYRSALIQLLRQPRHAVILLLLSFAEAFAYFAMPVALYHAFGLQGTSNVMVLTLHVLLFLASAFLPLPGAAGASESGFCIFMAGVYPQGDIAAAMMCWRFFGYYMLLLMGFATMVLGGVHSHRDHGGKTS